MTVAFNVTVTRISVVTFLTVKLYPILVLFMLSYVIKCFLQSF